MPDRFAIRERWPRFSPSSEAALWWKRPRFDYIKSDKFPPAIFSRLIILLSNSAVSAFVNPSADRASTALAAERREFLSAAVAAAAGLAVPGAALAVRDYENVGFLGGSDVIDVNNANVRVYLKMPGMYPTVAGKIASNGPYNSVSEVYNIPGLTSKEKEVIKKYESRFTALKPSADYVIDRINNGL